MYEVARRQGISSSLLYQSRRMGLGAHETSAAPQLIQVHVSAGAREPPSPSNPVSRPTRVERLAEIGLPNGCTVRVDQHVGGQALRSSGATAGRSASPGACTFSGRPPRS